MDSQMLIAVLAWACVVVGGALTSCLVWFAIRVLGQLDRLEKMVRDDMHQLDKRITKLEAWREGFEHGHRREGEPR